MPSRARTEEGEHTGPNDGVALGSVDAGGALIARPASRIRQMTPKQNGVSLLSTQVGTRGRSDSLRAFSNGSVKNGQTGFNDSAHIKTTTTTLTPRQRTRSPEDRRHSTGQLLICVPEDAEMSVDQMRASRSSETSRARGISIPRMTQTYYGSTPVTGYPASLEIDNEDDLSEEEEECLLDEELAKSGLFRGAFASAFLYDVAAINNFTGNYKNIILLYTFVPLTTLLAFVIFAFLPVFAFHSATPSTFPYPPYFPYPLPEVFTAAALWSLSYLLRDILYETSLLLTSWIPIPSRRFPNFIPFLSSLLAAILQNMSAIVLRQLAVPMLLIPRHSTERPLFDNGALYTAHHNFPTWEDVAFKRVWWVALGWAAAEAVVGIKQGYENIALYKDVLVNVHKMVNGETPATNHPISSTEVTTGIGQAGSSRQKSSESRRPLADREAQNTAEFSRRRDYSSSLSSIASGPYDDLAASTTLERQPLLTLRRQPADNSGMGSGAMAEDADRELVENIVEQDLQELMCLKSREEIEELYGMPVIVRR